MKIFFLAGLLFSAINLPAGSPWRHFVSTIRARQSVHVTFTQTYTEKASGMDIEDRGKLVALFGTGVGIQYEDGRLYILRKEGITAVEGEGEPQHWSWDEKGGDNPILWLVGLGAGDPKPLREEAGETTFGPRPGFWKGVIITWRESGKHPFPRSVEIIDEQNNSNLFTFDSIRWRVPPGDPLLKKVVG